MSSGKKTDDETKESITKSDEILEKIKKAFRDFGYILSGVEINSGAGNNYNMVEISDEDAAKEAELIANLRDMEEKYITEKHGLSFPDPDEVLPSSLDLKPIEYVKKSDAELASEAEASLKSGYEEKTDAATEKLIKSLDDLDVKRSKLEAEETEKKSVLDSNTEEAHRTYTDDMIRRGLVNSTIMSYGNELIDRMHDSAYEKYDKEYDAKYNEIRLKIAESELSYSNAIKEYDLKFAADLEQKIAKLKSQEASRLKEINEYNRKLAEKEASYQYRRNRKIAAMNRERVNAIIDAALKEQEEEKAFGVSKEKAAEYERRMDVAKAFYSGYDRQTANTMMLLSEVELKKLMGDTNYLMLLNWNNSREE